MIRIVKESEKNNFNKLAFHPLQSWEWGEFRLKTGIEVERFGRYENGKLAETAQITFHLIPFSSYKIGYFPKGNIPTKEMVEYLTVWGKKNNCIFIKFEPNLKKDLRFKIEDLRKELRVSPHPLFTKYTFELDLTKSEDELLKNMHPKTRYNIRLAEKKGVKITEDNSSVSFENYLKLLEETTTRQKFYAHTSSYHRLMWETLEKNKIVKLLLAKYKNGDNEETLVAWILFLFNKVLYYPYGASSSQYKNLMASNLMMWEAIKFGKKMGAVKFDMWGALGTDPDPNDPWYGFHKFKEGYGAELVELEGSFDLIIKPWTYLAYNLVHNIRELYLKLRK